MKEMKEDYISMKAASFDVFAGRLIRIGHMGQKSRVKYIAKYFEALQKVLEKHGVSLHGNMKETF